jgi:outer membrane protein assembly factor BamB
MNTLKQFLVAIVTWSTVVWTFSVRAADWSQWRGANRDGISTETGLLKEWPAQGPKMLWQVKELGEGYSTPAIVGERLYVMANKGVADEFVKALSVQDGNEMWARRVGKVGPNEGPQYPAARSTPTVDGDALYALGSDGDLVCLDTASGQVRWQKNLRNDFGGQAGKWAYAESPLVDGEVVVVTPGGPQATIVALNKKTGEVVWKSVIPGGDPAGYASIIPVDVGGSKQYVQFLEKGLVGVDAKTGSFLWRYDQTAKGSPANIPTPVAHDGYVYSATNLGGGGLVRIKPGADGKVEVEQVYFAKKLPSAIGGSVLVGDYLYGAGQVMMCVEFKTGKVKWSERGVGAASVMFADGRLYVHGESGEVALVEASPEAYREKGRFAPPDPAQRSAAGAKAWAYPVVANGRLYVRDGNCLWCYDVKDVAR